MKFSLRTLIVVMLLAPPLLAMAWWYWKLALVVALVALAFGGPDALFIPLYLVGSAVGAIVRYVSSKNSEAKPKD